MAAMSAGASVLAHGLHYSVLGAGLLGLLVLLGPGFTTTTPRYDEHDRRVQQLRRQFGDTLTLTATPATTPATTPIATGTRVERLLIPLALVSSAAAAGVHAAVGPDHFRERILFGLFFAVSALLQLGWSLLVAHRPTRTLMAIGAAGNLAVVALWLTTRTLGLPGGLLPQPEAIGPWDLAAVGWELSVVVTCLLALLSGERVPHPMPWRRWSATARAWTLGSALVLVLLSLSGAGS